MRKISLMFLVLAGCTKPQLPQPHRYTCKEIWGEHPHAGYMEVLPAHYSAVAGSIGGEGHSDFRVWDENNRLVCDCQGKDIRPGTKEADAAQAGCR
jgi:hypothetical protein